AEDRRDVIDYLERAGPCAGAPRGQAGSVVATAPSPPSGSPSVTGGGGTTESTIPANGARTPWGAVPGGSRRRPARVPAARCCIGSTAACQRPVAGDLRTSFRSIHTGRSTRADGRSWIPRWAIRLSAPRSWLATEASSVRPIPPDSVVTAGFPLRIAVFVVKALRAGSLDRPRSTTMWSRR